VFMTSDKRALGVCVCACVLARRRRARGRCAISRSTSKCVEKTASRSLALSHSSPPTLSPPFPLFSVICRVGGRGEKARERRKRDREGESEREDNIQTIYLKPKELHVFFTPFYLDSVL
jgi:hypothetical protein